MTSLSFIVVLLASSSASGFDADCACNTFLQPTPVQPYYNQDLGPYFGNLGNPAVQFFGNGPATPPPVAAAPAGAAAPPPLGPTDDCPCMTTPNPNTTPAPGSPDDAKKDIEKSIEELSKEKTKEAEDVTNKAGKGQVDEVSKLSAEAGELTRAKLTKVGDQEIDVIEGRMQEEKDREELKMDSLRGRAKLKGKIQAEEVTQATEEVGDAKARTVIGNVMAGTKREMVESNNRAVEISREAENMVHEAKLSAERVENAAKEAQMAAMKEPRHRAAEAQRQAIAAGEHALSMQDEALQSQKIAEAAAAIAWEAQKTANKALADSKLAVKASESAYADALVNKENLVKLKDRAKQAEKEVKVAVTSAINAEQQATGAGQEIAKFGYVS